MMNLETYLRNNCGRNVIDHALRATIEADGTMSFYLHPANTDGDTLDFKVAANTLTQKHGDAQQEG
jgi:uncharacterized membrane protein YcaP (DUF421 family)